MQQSRRKQKQRPWDTRINAFEEAAAEVLRRAQRPLSAIELMERMIQDGLVVPTGKTPHKSLYNIIRRANARREAAGDAPRFQPHGDRNLVKYSLHGD